MCLLSREHLNFNLTVVWWFKIVAIIKWAFGYFNTSFTYVINDNFENEQNTYLITAIIYVSEE